MSERKLFIADKELVVTQSEDSESQFCYTPSIARCPNGQYLVSYDLGGDVTHLHGYSPFPNSRQKMLCRVVRFDEDKGCSALVRAFPLCHARLFAVDDHVYLLGHDGRLKIARANANGEQWSKLVELDGADGWHGSACNVLVTKRRVYLCMERRIDHRIAGWNVAGMAPVLLSVERGKDFLIASNWKKSHTFTFSDAVREHGQDLFGIPFFPAGFRGPWIGGSGASFIKSAPMGWLEGNVVEFGEASHIMHDPRGKTFYLLLRCNTGGTGYATILKVFEDENDDLFVDFVYAPSGVRLLFLPFPGGHNKFFLDFDKRSECFWLASTQPLDSCRRPDRAGPREFGLPNNERHRLVLHYSRNCVDWIFAGVIAIGATPEQSRNYPAFAFDNKDIVMVARSGNADSKDSQYSNMVTFYRVRNFRQLMY